MSSASARPRSARRSRRAGPPSAGQDPAQSLGQSPGQDLGQSSGQIGGQSAGRFPARRVPTDEELAQAREQAARIHGLSSLKVSTSLISRITRTPVGAVETVLGETPPAPPEVPAAAPGLAALAETPASPTGIPPGQAASPLGDLEDPDNQFNPSTPRRAYPRYEDFSPDRDDAYNHPNAERRPRNPLDEPGPRAQEPALALFRQMTSSNIAEGRAKLVCRAFRALKPNDYVGLRSLMAKGGIPPQTIDLLISDYRMSVGDPETLGSDASYVGVVPAADANAALRQRLAQLREQRMLDAELALLERQAQTTPQPALAPSADVERLKAELAAREREIAALVQREHDRVQLDGFNQLLAPLRQDLEALKNRPSEKRSLTDVEVEGASVKNEAQKKSLEILANRAASAPKLLEKVDRISDLILDTPALGATIQRRVSDAVGSVGQAPTGGTGPQEPPTDEQYMEAVREIDKMMPPGTAGPQPSGPPPLPTAEHPRPRASIPGSQGGVSFS
ncbi:MAG TPA: hypothetical protein VGX00_08540 [Thermoplasmata archaeon]|nr:hypothetical protein [Thermoplasmata archaeon]